MITIINNCQNRVSADQCHMTVSWGQVITSLSWRVYLNIVHWPIISGHGRRSIFQEGVSFLIASAKS